MGGSERVWPQDAWLGVDGRHFADSITLIMYVS
jgi:hypothetical protein